ncbi:MAG: endonuclease [Bacteroidetes bacterium]|nr:endonuclease [Bacteroidota bacterium]
MKKYLVSTFVLIFSVVVLAQPAGYYNGTAGLTGAALKTKLSQIITNGHLDKGYSGLWTAYQTTDRDYYYENDGTVLDIYSENPTGPDLYNFIIITNQCSGGSGGEGFCYNREHIVPQSLFSSQTPMYSDVNFIRATDSKVNGMRGNNPFGKVGSASFTSMNGSKLGTSISPGFSGTVFEPIDEFKGDVARMIFYFVTRYENQLSGFSSGNMLGNSPFPGLQTWELNQLLIWSNQDPVSPAEIGRNNATFAWQGNRNPFIDNPQWANDIWGTVDNIPPTAATNLTTSGATTNSIALSWTAATDNIGVVGYDIYVNGVYYSTVTGTSATVNGLNPSTNYNFFVIAKDGAGNQSPQSNVATGTTLAGSGGGSTTICGTETFENIPTTNTSGYETRTWTNNSITWTSTDSRTDQTITNGKAICVRNGNLLSSSISGGISSITMTTQLKFGGSAGNLNIEINGVNVGTIAYSATTGTFSINNINISGNFTIKIIQPTTGNRVAIDDLSWTCYSLSVDETKAKDRLVFYPNPTHDNFVFVKGNQLEKIETLSIFTMDGRLIKNIYNPFKNTNQLMLPKLPKGKYLLKTKDISQTLLVE